MPINRPIDDLPMPDRPVGNQPATSSVVVDRLANAWYEHDQAAHNGAKAIPELPFRLSAVSNRCDRQMVYSMTNEPASNPPTIADSWRMGLGTMVHESLQSVLANFGDGWQSEVTVDLRDIGVDGSGHVDLYNPATKTVVELKTVNGFSFKMKATGFKGPAEGPSWAHILQGALAARALGADTMIIAYLSMELVGPELARSYSTSEVGRFAAEWHYNMADLNPAVDKEIARIRRLTAAARAGVLPSRMLDDPSIPAGASVVSPQTGNWSVVDAVGNVQQAGKVWFCNYCRYQDTCTAVKD